MASVDQAGAPEREAPHGNPARAGGQRRLTGIGIAVVVLALAGLAVAPFFLYPVFVMSVMCFALFATAFNLLLGYVGLLSFGHAAFFGGAAYFAAHAAKVWGWEPLSAILLGAVGAGVMGVAVGFLAIRRQGIYFAMVTLALSQMIFFIFLQAPFTHGEDGIQNVPRGDLLGVLDLGRTLNLYYFVLAVFLVGSFAVWRIVHSPFGQVLKSIRENEPRAISLGLPGGPLQARGLQHVGRGRGARGGHQGHRVPDCDAHRRRLADVGRGGADDALGRHGHHPRPRRGRRACGGDAEPVRELGLPRDGSRGRHLRALRAPVPPRHRRRGDPPPGALTRRWGGAR